MLSYSRIVPPCLNNSRSPKEVSRSRNKTEIPSLQSYRLSSTSSSSSSASPRSCSRARSACSFGGRNSRVIRTQRHSLRRYCLKQYGLPSTSPSKTGAVGIAPDLQRLLASLSGLAPACALEIAASLPAPPRQPRFFRPADKGVMTLVSCEPAPELPLPAPVAEFLSSSAAANLGASKSAGSAPSAPSSAESESRSSSKKAAIPGVSARAVATNASLQDAEPGPQGQIT